MDDAPALVQRRPTGTPFAPRMAERRRIGRTGLTVAPLGLGTVPLGNYPAPLAEEEALATVRAAIDVGITLFETAPLYGRGLAERRLGLALHGAHGERVVATKIGRLLVPKRGQGFTADRGADIFVDPAPFDTVFDYSFDGAMRSLDQSLQRLGLDRVEIIHIHNIDAALHSEETVERMFAQCMQGAYRALHQMREQGVIQGIGVGNNSLPMLGRFLAAGDFDCFMMAGHYNLLEQTAANELLDACQRRNVAILLGSPFASGVLATGARADARHAYAALTAEVANRVGALEAVCERFDVPLAAAALQFPLAHPAIAAVVAGCASAKQVRANVRALCTSVPRACWNELRAVAGWDHTLPLPDEALLVGSTA